MTPEKVTERLWIAGQLTPAIISFCRSNGITDILNVAQELDDHRLASPAEFRLEKIGLLDVNLPLPSDHLAQILKRGLHILADPKDKLLIHCHAGRNRSPSAAYLLLRGFGLPRNRAVTFIPGGSFPKYADSVDFYLSKLQREG